VIPADANLLLYSCDTSALEYPAARAWLEQRRFSSEPAEATPLPGAS
jgi:hypothetical protein